jgi:rhamnogalacturonan endolyase
MVSVNLKAGLNILYLKSLEENGAPNLDQLAFDVPGVSLYESESQLSGIDSLQVKAGESGETQISGKDSTQKSADVRDSSVQKNSDPAQKVSESAALNSNLRLANGVYVNFSENTIVTHHGGNVELGFFDMKGHCIARIAKNVPAGNTDLGEQVKNLPGGIYVVQVKFNGKKLKNVMRTKINR